MNELLVFGEEGRSSVKESEARRSIDDLVTEAHRYRSSNAYRDLLQFAGTFRRYSPFNALLVHSQRDGASYVAPAHRWRGDFGRLVKPGEQPLVVLQPFGPVMFVYDISQTEPFPGARPLPPEITNPYAMQTMTSVDPALSLTVENAKHDGVRVTLVPSGSLAAGCISRVSHGLSQRVQLKRRPPEWAEVPIRYETHLNDQFTPTEQYATLAHELGHLYCGHLGTPNPKWWPARSYVTDIVAEFEAESVAYIACRRVDARAVMPPHLAQYLHENPDVPDGLSLDRVMTAAGRVVEMANQRVKPRAQ
jgi:hypothetical protein